MNGAMATTITPRPRPQPRVGSKHDISADGFIRLAPKTHDISLIGEHIPSISHLAADLEKAVKAGWSRRHDIRYSKVQVLTLRWEDDDLGVITELKALGHVFADLYHYEVRTYSIPREKPDEALKRRVLDFLEHDGPETLLIVYYAGHAISSLQSNEAPIWSANRNIGSPSLPSAGIQSMFEEADADVLLLYDCCNSAATRASSLNQGNRGVTEVIAACEYEAIAPEVGKHSFSTALTEVLAAASKGAPPAPFSVAELHARILNRLKCWTPSFVKDNHGKFKEDLGGRLEYERQPRRTPIYSILCETEPRRSIILAPLKNMDPLNVISVPNDGNLQPVHEPPSQPIYSQHFSSDDRLKKRKRPSGEGIEYPQVLLAIRLDKHELDLDAWKECLLRQLPTEAKDIKIEGIFSSFSTLLLLRLPVAVWDLLPGNPAYSFIGFVTSENKAIAASPGCSSASTSVDTKTQSSGEVGLGQINDHFSTTPIDPNLLPPYNHSMMISNSASPSYDIEDSQPDEMSEYSNYQPSEFSDIEDPFFGVNFDAGVQRLDSIFGLQGVTSQTAQPLETEPDRINLMATSSVNPADSNSLNSPKIASPRNVRSPPASTRSSSPSRDPPFSPYLTSVSSPPPLSTGQAINSRNSCLNTFDFDVDKSAHPTIHMIAASRLQDSLSKDVSRDVRPAVLNRSIPFEAQPSIPGPHFSRNALVQPDPPRLRKVLTPYFSNSRSPRELINDERPPEMSSELGNITPSLNQQAERRQVDMTNFEVEIWRSEVGGSDNAVNEDLDAQNSHRMHQPEEENGIPPVSDSVSIRENRLVEGQVYYNLERMAPAETDIEMLNQMRYWSDPPSLPYMTKTNYQPLTANEAIRKFNQNSDLYSTDSRRASWGTRARSPFVEEFELNLTGGSIFKRIFFKKMDTGQEFRSPDRHSSFFDQGLALLANLTKSRGTSELRKPGRSSPHHDYDTSGSMKRKLSHTFGSDTNEKDFTKVDLSLKQYGFESSKTAEENGGRMI